MSDSTLDEIDRAILFYLQEDGRRAVTEIADRINVADNTVRNRIQAMEESGVIAGYSVDVDYNAAGVQHHYMFVCSTRVSQREELAAEARKLPNVIEVITLMTGNHNVFLIGSCSDKDEISHLAHTLDELGLHIEREHLIYDHIRQAHSGFSPPDHLTRK